MWYMVHCKWYTVYDILCNIWYLSWYIDAVYDILYTTYDTTYNDIIWLVLI